MSFEIELNKLYNEIAQQVNDMIPIEWENFYFNGEVKEREGGVFFFFKPKGEEQYIFSHYIPKLYSVDKRAYNKELHKLFELTVELQKVFTDNDQEPWFSVTLLVNDTGKLNVHFDYTNWHESEFSPAARIEYFMYKYGSNNKEKLDLGLIERMKEFEESNI
ncbi:immunity protein YezG family protein [Virgibacillus necropolis]|uniref:GNAT family acetyltransferase n=1 Tax=Virgibacillus necropolis TaxID=163877 RepID=A0A221M992_9BACI|nr:immunity protein YezG family protein [Virgibacillus necropolis]ASN04218.1 GNAT family acetyltransferase [Virgibacillus necropolis]